MIPVNVGESNVEHRQKESEKEHPEPKGNYLFGMEEKRGGEGYQAIVDSDSEGEIEDEEIENVKIKREIVHKEEERKMKEKPQTEKKKMKKVSRQKQSEGNRFISHDFDLPVSNSSSNHPNVLKMAPSRPSQSSGFGGSAPPRNLSQNFSAPPPPSPGIYF